MRSHYLTVLFLAIVALAAMPFAASAEFVPTGAVGTTNLQAPPLPGGQTYGDDPSGDHPLVTTFDWSGHGGVIIKPIPFEYANNPSGIFSVDSIPTGSTILYANFTVTDWPPEGTPLASCIFNGVQQAAILPTFHDPCTDIVSCHYR